MKALIACCLVIIAGCSASPRPWTKGEIGLAAFSTAASAFNYYQSERMLDRPGTYEFLPYLPQHPSDFELGASMATTQLVTLVIAHYLPTIDVPLFGECELRVPLLVGKSATNIYLGIHDSGVGE